MDSPTVARAKRLLDAVKDQGFVFTRFGPGEDAPVLGVRESLEWVDEIFLGGFSVDCTAVRRRKSSFIVPGELPVADQVAGDALTVLHTVLSEWSTC